MYKVLGADFLSIPLWQFPFSNSPLAILFPSAILPQPSIFPLSAIFPSKSLPHPKSLLSPKKPKPKAQKPKAKDLPAKNPLTCTIESSVQEAGRHTPAISNISIPLASSFRESFICSGKGGGGATALGRGVTL
jgi:hypothetical protein